jgi:hypothetical protein
MLDQAVVQTILERCFPGASATQVRCAAQDILMLDLLVDERLGVEWEDRMHDPQPPWFSTLDGSAGRHS